MNNITEITILIAVVALALWPAVIIIMLMKAEKRLACSLKENSCSGKRDNCIITEEYITAILKKIGCSPEKSDNGNIAFMYQGDDFYASLQENNQIIMIWYPWWGTINVDNPLLPYLKEVINAVNISSFVTTVFMSENEDDNEIGIHSHCHISVAVNDYEPEEHIKIILDSFFETRETIKDSINKLGSQLPGEVNEEKKERVIVKGFSSYKENSIPIETQDAKR